jgi:hypothetical protein
MNNRQQVLELYGWKLFWYILIFWFIPSKRKIRCIINSLKEHYDREKTPDTIQPVPTEIFIYDYIYNNMADKFKIQDQNKRRVMFFRTLHTGSELDDVDISLIIS